MNKLIGLAVSALLLLPVPGRAEFLEGVEYQRVPAQTVETGARIEVREFFWYGCPHCYALEPFLEKWIKTMPKNAQFIRTPAALNDRWKVHARAYYAFQTLGLTARLHGPLFSAMQVDKRPLSDVDSLAAFVAEKGGDRKAFEDAYNSFGVQAAVNHALQVARAYQIESVPTLIVDGKFMTNANIAGGHDQVLEVLDFLIRKSAAERQSRKR
jgi:thiol:disulfide interchange protein DsbA